MTDPNYTHLAVILDRSSSMGLIRDATIEAFNGFISQQQKVPGRADITLTMFSDEVHVGTTPLWAALQLTRETYRPLGNTALFDAIGKTIDVVGRSLAALPEAERPGRVLIVIQTDGQENASHEYTQEKVRSMIEHQRTVYGWQFIFLGAEANTFLVAKSIDIPTSGVLRYAATAGGVTRALAATNDVSTSYRSGGAVAFAQQDVQ